MEKYYLYGPKEYLKTYLKYKNRAETFKAELEEVADPRETIRMDGLPRKGGINHPTEEAAITLARARKRYQPLIEEAETICSDIIDTVNSIEPKAARLLYLKYCKGFPWHKVAKDLYYSEAYVKKELHANALDQLEIAIKRKYHDR